MKRRDDEQIIDELIGEAALSLLNSKSVINTRALISRLQIMLMSEQNQRRQELLDKVIREIECNAYLPSAGKTEKGLPSLAVDSDQHNVKKIH